MLLILFVLCTVCSSQVYCGNYGCSWTVDEYTLDLCSFRRIGVNLTAHDGEYNYYFSPANNLIPNSTDDFGHPYYMALQANNSEHTVNYLASFADNVEPKISFDADNNIIWNFQYSHDFGIQYSCDYSVDVMQIQQILEVLPNSYLMQVSSKYICNNFTTPSAADLGRSQCIWSDSEIYSSILNLTALYGECIETDPDIYSQYTYCICQNNLYTSLYGEYCGMYQYYSSNLNFSSNYIFWDPTVRPRLNTTTKSWFFEYPNAVIGYRSGSHQTIEWICDKNIDSYSILSTNANIMQIASKYACPPDCTFIDSENYSNVLDLLPIIGNTIEFIDNNLEYSFIYTPCSNNVFCGEKSVMAMRWDIDQRECNPYLAVWDGVDNGYTLYYNDDTNEWEFTYNNGKPCVNKGGNTQFNIHWKCNELINDWNVTNVEEINECSYIMYIDSQYAC